jgi:hypothetical protein
MTILAVLLPFRRRRDDAASDTAAVARQQAEPTHIYRVSLSALVFGHCLVHRRICRWTSFFDRGLSECRSGRLSSWRLRALSPQRFRHFLGYPVYPIKIYLAVQTAQCSPRKYHLLKSSAIKMKIYITVPISIFLSRMASYAPNS